MSKTALKKFIAGLSRQQLAEVLLQVYDAKKEAREYLDYFVDPDEEGALEKYRGVVLKEFKPPKGRARRRVTVCRRAIKDFLVLEPSAAHVNDLTLTYLEQLVIHFVENPNEKTSTQTNEFLAQSRALAERLATTGSTAEFDNRLAAIVRTAEYADDDLPELIGSFLELPETTDAKPLATRRVAKGYRFFRRKRY